MFRMRRMNCLSKLKDKISNKKFSKYLKILNYRDSKNFFKRGNN